MAANVSVRESEKVDRKDKPTGAGKGEVQVKPAIPLMRVADLTKPTVTTPLPLEMLAVRINEEVAGVLAGFRSSLEHARAAGDLLLEAKGQVKHGQWADWLDNSCLMSERTAQAYMRVAGRWDEIKAKTQSAADLTLAEALKLLVKPTAAKSQPEPAGPAAETKQESPNPVAVAPVQAKAQQMPPAQKPLASSPAKGGKSSPEVAVPQVMYDLAAGFPTHTPPASERRIERWPVDSSIVVRDLCRQLGGPGAGKLFLVVKPGLATELARRHARGLPEDG